MINRKALKEIARRFDDNKIIWGLGGTCMMLLQGLDVDPRDFDLIVIPQDFELALRILSEAGTFEQYGPSGIYASQHYAHGTFMDCPVDLIAGFRIITSDRIIDYHFDADRVIKIDCDKISIPCCLLEDWIGLYEAMDKHAKADMMKRKCDQITFEFD